MSGLLVVAGLVIALGIGHVLDRRRQRYYDEYRALHDRHEAQRRRVERALGVDDDRGER